MSALSAAHAHLVKAVDELETAVDEVPSYSIDSLRFLKAELKDATRRIQNVRRMIVDSVPASASAEAAGKVAAG